MLPNSDLLTVSVVIPTKYRPEVVERTVASVLAQTRPVTQIVIVDQSSTAETQQRINARYSTTAKERLPKLTYLYDPSGIKGAAAARNRGMDLAESGIWLFLDDDVLLECDFIDQLMHVYRQQPEAAGVSGVFTNYPQPGALFRLFSAAFVRGPFRDERQPIYWKAEKLRGSPPMRVRKFTGALMSFRADVVRHLRFDENVRGTGPEDADFCARLPGDALLLVTPNARLFHERAAAGRSTEIWLATDIQRAYYLYLRNWRADRFARYCLGWMALGYGFAAVLSCIRRRSLRSWNAFVGAFGQGALDARVVS